MSTVLHGRYRVLDDIGQGGQARTYLAEDQQTGREVAVKVLNFARIDEAKSMELFEREAEALERIDHPSVPEYIDHFFEETDDGGGRYALVQEYVEGEALDELLEGGWQIDEQEACRLARELLEILDYLQDLDPPVFHRDLKPSNVLRRPDGSYVLVDFGGVRVALPDDKSGSTVIGSHGHMAPEQLMGRADATSDLYGLGATLVHLLSRKDPSEMTDGMEMEFEDYVQVSDAFEVYLDGLLASTIGERYPSAEDALDVLSQLEADSSDGSSVPLSRDFEAWRRAPDCDRLHVECTEQGGLHIRFDALSTFELIREIGREFVRGCIDLSRYLLQEGKEDWLAELLAIYLFGGPMALLLLLSLELSGDNIPGSVWYGVITSIPLAWGLLMLRLNSWREVPWSQHRDHLKRYEFDISPHKYDLYIDGELVQSGPIEDLEKPESRPYRPTHRALAETVHLATTDRDIRFPPGLSARDREQLTSRIATIMPSD